MRESNSLAPTFLLKLRCWENGYFHPYARRRNELNIAVTLKQNWNELLFLALEPQVPKALSLFLNIWMDTFNFEIKGSSKPVLLKFLLLRFTYSLCVHYLGVRLQSSNFYWYSSPQVNLTSKFQYQLNKFTKLLSGEWRECYKIYNGMYICMCVTNEAVKTRSWDNSSQMLQWKSEQNISELG